MSKAAQEYRKGNKGPIYRDMYPQTTAAQSKYQSTMEHMPQQPNWKTKQYSHDGSAADKGLDSRHALVQTRVRRPPALVSGLVAWFFVCTRTAG